MVECLEGTREMGTCFLFEKKRKKKKREKERKKEKGEYVVQDSIPSLHFARLSLIRESTIHILPRILLKFCTKIKSSFLI